VDADSLTFACSIGELEGNLLAGFLEGEIHLAIREQNAGQSLSCLAQLNVRDDDAEILEWIIAMTGLGTLGRVPAQRTSKPQIRWCVVTRADCAELVRLLERFSFHGRKRLEFDRWSRAVRVWNSDSPSRCAELREIKAELHDLRRYSDYCLANATSLPNLTALQGYISGFLLAEAHLQLTDKEARAAVNLRADDEALLRMLAAASAMGSVRRYSPSPPANPVVRWTIAARDQLARLGSWLLDAGLPGHKGDLARIWAEGVIDFSRAGRREVAAAHLARVRPYRAPAGRDLLAVAKPELAARCRDALVAWARDESGPLSCCAYARWRREHRDCPTRNTIAREFGGWQGALRAAGLGDRVARPPRRIGGEVGRARRRDEQRARVLTAVRRFEAEHGRLPRAIEFFRWRFQAAPDAPSQGTVYNLFPGGWPAVIAAL
jgi:hypothetical protein